MKNALIIYSFLKCGHPACREKVHPSICILKKKMLIL